MFRTQFFNETGYFAPYNITFTFGNGTDPENKTDLCVLSKRPWHDSTFYSFTKMRPFLEPTVRIKKTTIAVGANYHQVEQLESVSYLWRNGDIHLASQRSFVDFQLVLKLPTILRCRNLYMEYANVSLKKFKVLYTVKMIETCHGNSTFWLEFLEQPGVKPLIVVRGEFREEITDTLDVLCEVI